MEVNNDSLDNAAANIVKLKRVYTISEDQKFLKLSNVNQCGLQKKKEAIAALRNLLVKNNNHLLFLSSLEDTFTNQLTKCSAELSEVSDKILEQEQGSKKLYVKSRLLKFGTPYFRYNDTTPQGNADVLLLEELADIKYIDVPMPQIWLDAEKQLLLKVILEEERNRQVKDVELDKLRIRKRLDVTFNEDKMSVLESDVELLTQRIATIKSMTASELMKNSLGKHDWLKISNIDMKGKHTPQECESMWTNYLHPCINKRRWKEGEDEKLKRLVQKHAFQNWGSIASELDTSRSAFQCMCHYQTRLNPMISRTSWDENDDSTLRLLVESLRKGDYVPWKKIAYCFSNCPVTNLIARWRTINPEVVKGKFSEAEDICLVAAVKKFGQDFKKIADHFPGRTSTQLMERYKLFKKHNQVPSPWTPEDDRLIWEKVKEFGHNFSHISTYFTNRDRTQVRHRYYRMVDWLQKHPEEDYPACRSGRLKVADGPDELWKKVVTLMKDKRVKFKEIDGEAVLDNRTFSSLTNKMKVSKKTGRKTGRQKHFQKVDLEIAKYFSCLYPQIGGRNKIHYTDEEIENDHCATVKFLEFLGAQLTDVSQQSFEGDERFSRIDHLVLRKLVVNCSSGNEPSAEAEASTSGAASRVSSDIPEINSSPCCNVCSVPHGQMSYVNVFHNAVPPNQTTLIGIRSIMLWRNVLKSISYPHDVKLEGTVDECGSSNQLDLCLSNTNGGGNSEASEVVEEPVSTNAAFIKHSDIWKARFRSLFSWAALCSENAPKVLPNACSLCGESDDTRNIPENIMEFIRDKETKRNAANVKRKRTK